MGVTEADVAIGDRQAQPCLTDQVVLIDAWAVIVECVAVQEDVPANDAALQVAEDVSRQVFLLRVEV